MRVVRPSGVIASAVILDINSDWISHWSVLSGVTGDRLALYDSNGMKTTATVACEPFLAIRAKLNGQLLKR